MRPLLSLILILSIMYPPAAGASSSRKVKAYTQPSDRYSSYRVESNKNIQKARQSTPVQKAPKIDNSELADLVRTNRSSEKYWSVRFTDYDGKERHIVTGRPSLEERKKHRPSELEKHIEELKKAQAQKAQRQSLLAQYK